jgi:hypothetical protein
VVRDSIARAGQRQMTACSDNLAITLQSCSLAARSRSLCQIRHENRRIGYPFGNEKGGSMATKWGMQAARWYALLTAFILVLAVLGQLPHERNWYDLTALILVLGGLACLAWPHVRSTRANPPARSNALSAAPTAGARPRMVANESALRG